MQTIDLIVQKKGENKINKDKHTISLIFASELFSSFRMTITSIIQRQHQEENHRQTKMLLLDLSLQIFLTEIKIKLHTCIHLH